MIRAPADVLKRLTNDLPDKILTRGEIVRWWEWRRFAFNVLVGIVGVATWFSVLIFGSMAVKLGVDFEEPLGMILGPFLWAFLRQCLLHLRMASRRDCLQREASLSAIQNRAYLFACTYCSPGVVGADCMADHSRYWAEDGLAVTNLSAAEGHLGGSLNLPPYVTNPLQTS